MLIYNCTKLLHASLVSLVSIDAVPTYDIALRERVRNVELYARLVKCMEDVDMHAYMKRTSFSKSTCMTVRTGHASV
eukprot:scaffold80877_cov17-Prasinocladus_malaysianus.AAC.1